MIRKKIKFKNENFFGFVYKLTHLSKKARYKFRKTRGYISGNSQSQLEADKSVWETLVSNWSTVTLSHWATEADDYRMSWKDGPEGGYNCIKMISSINLSGVITQPCPARIPLHCNVFPNVFLYSTEQVVFLVPVRNSSVSTNILPMTQAL